MFNKKSKFITGKKTSEKGSKLLQLAKEAWTHTQKPNEEDEKMNLRQKNTSHTKQALTTNLVYRTCALNRFESPSTKSNQDSNGPKHPLN